MALYGVKVSFYGTLIIILLLKLIIWIKSIYIPNFCIKFISVGIPLFKITGFLSVGYIVYINYGELVLFRYVIS